MASDTPDRTGKKGEGRDLVILVCGDRNWNDFDKIEAKLIEHNPYKIIEGEAPGADVIGREIAQQLKISVDPMPANWDRYGRSAGPIRNRQMLRRLQWYRDEHGYDTLVLAFHSNLENSKGTKDMVTISKKADVPVEVVT